MKQLISFLAAICLLCSLASVSFADGEDTTGRTTPVYASINGGTFSVKVPSKIGITAENNGVLSTYTIYNMGDLPVKISSIAVNGFGNWTQVTDNFSAYKQFKIDITGAGEKIAAGSSGTYNYTASIPANQPNTINEQIATVVFTIDVDDTFFCPLPPKAVSPTLVTIMDNDYYRIAEQNNCSLLLLKEPIPDGSNYQVPDCALISDISNNISLPGAGSSNYFELSKEEFTKYCSTETNYEGTYCLRSAGYYINFNNIVEGSPSIINHRYAIWVPNSSLPTT